MSSGKRYVAATALSLGLIAVLLLFVSLEFPLTNDTPTQLVARGIDLAVPPPPPPPAVETRAEQSRPDIEIATVEPSSKKSLLEDLSLDVDVPAGRLNGSLEGGGFGNGAGGFGVQWDGFDLPYLDSTPSVVSAPPVSYPQELLDRGIMSMEIEVLIQVDEEGKTTLLDILRTPYPPYNDALRQFVNDVRFTSPTVGGRKVKAIYAWPLGIQAE